MSLEKGQYKIGIDDEQIHLELCEAARLKQAVFQLPVVKVISVKVIMLMLMLMLTMVVMLIMIMMTCCLNERIHISSFM